MIKPSLNRPLFWYTHPVKKLPAIHEQDIVPGAPEVNRAGFSHREAARAIVVDDTGAIAMLAVTKKGYHKLPGGGLEPGEDKTQALTRELLEEIGCKVKILGEVGEITEYRDQWEQIQTSYCYLALKMGEQHEPAFTEEELNDGFQVVWFDNIDAAIGAMEADTAESYGAKFMRRRDLAFMIEARLALQEL